MNTDQTIYLEIITALMSNANRPLHPDEIVQVADSYYAAIQPRVAAIV